MVSKPYVCENDETTKDTKAGEDKVDECVWVLGERKSVLGYQKPLVSLTLPRTGVSLLLLWSALSYLELGSAFVNQGSLLTLCIVEQSRAFR